MQSQVVASGQGEGHESDEEGILPEGPMDLSRVTSIGGGNDGDDSSTPSDGGGGEESTNDERTFFLAVSNDEGDASSGTCRRRTDVGIGEKSSFSIKVAATSS